MIILLEKLSYKVLKRNEIGSEFWKEMTLFKKIRKQQIYFSLILIGVPLAGGDSLVCST